MEEGKKAFVDPTVARDEQRPLVVNWQSSLERFHETI